MGGGNADNAIPRSAECVFIADDISGIDFEGALKGEFGAIESDMAVTLAKVQGEFLGCDKESSKTAISYNRVSFIVLACKFLLRFFSKLSNSIVV